jgi:predicted Holliday junction resolvase-like endonuclease
MGFLAALIICCVIFCGMLPLMGLMYLDIQQTKKEVQMETKKLQELRRKVEKERENERETGS